MFLIANYVLLCILFQTFFEIFNILFLRKETIEKFTIYYGSFGFKNINLYFLKQFQGFK